MQINCITTRIAENNSQMIHRSYMYMSLSGNINTVNDNCYPMSTKHFATSIVDMVSHAQCISKSAVLYLIPGILCFHNSITGVIHKFSTKTGNSRNEAQQLSDEVMNILPPSILKKGRFQSKENKAYTPSCNNRKRNFFTL